MPSLAAVTVPAPPRQPHKFGLFSAVPIHPANDPHMLMGVQWEPDTCARPKTMPEQCPCPTAVDFSPPSPVQDADPFTVVGTWTCALGGYTPAYAQEKARANLAAGEQQAVEWGIWTGDTELYGPIGDDSPQRFHGPRFADPTTPVIGEVKCATDLLAVIEQWTASRYTGAPIVHLPRPVLPYLAADHLLTTVSNRLETTYGTQLVAGAGYAEANTGPDGTKAPDGSWWVYVTGALNVYRSDVFTPPDAADGFVRCNNEMLAVAMRTYLVGWDCITAAVLFTPCCECGQPTGVTP
jgi:hypothetical protein